MIKKNQKEVQEHMHNGEEVARELGEANSIDDFYGKDGIFAKLLSMTIEEMLSAELTIQLGYEPYENFSQSFTRF